MEFIAHRINTIAELATLPHKFGVELDLRDNLNGRIYIQHNPFEVGDDFEEYLSHYKHGTLILNIKSERIELKALELLQQFKIKQYFFLDSTFPMIVLLSNGGETNISLRFSEFEKMDTIIAMAGKAKWIWVDCFTKIPVSTDDIQNLNALGFKTCFVSPELQGRPEDVEAYIAVLNKNKIKFDAICTKVYNIPTWQRSYTYASLEA